MLNFEIRNADTAVISGYVNAVERESRVLHRVGGLPLREDNIGLFAKAVISDKEVISCAKNGKLTGWSFGFKCKKDTWNDTGEIRTLEEIELDEVSILTKTPAYTATSIELRDGDILRECRFESDITVEKPVEIAENSRFQQQKKYFEFLKGSIYHD